ncbi:hypothetical protein DFP72DRAFT_834511, partial [Ephemerocybe angulata]
VDISWPSPYNIGSGLYNVGNTCYLNCVLQCLIHTPPLLRILDHHSAQICSKDGDFCLTCSLGLIAKRAHDNSGRPFIPTPVTTHIQRIAGHMEHGRQEDAHEFLRYVVEAFHRDLIFSNENDGPEKANWVNQIFGGRLRSRITCRGCGHNSEKMESNLDFSLEIDDISTIQDAFERFTSAEYLSGANQYQCESCMRLYNAKKQLLIQEAPVVLTVHLKRFSSQGHKLTHRVDFDEKLSLGPYMTDTQLRPSYRLHGVICHVQIDSNSGHYYAIVQSRDGRWFKMDDEFVHEADPPLNHRSAYVLFYLREDESVTATAGLRPRGMVGRLTGAQDGGIAFVGYGSTSRNADHNHITAFSETMRNIQGSKALPSVGQVEGVRLERRVINPYHSIYAFPAENGRLRPAHGL